MEKEFVPYEFAVLLKHLGFNEPCFAFYQREYTEVTPTMVDDNEQYKLTGFRTCKNSEIPEHYVSAPTFSQAFRWFRENDFLISFSSHDKDTHDFYIKWGTMEQGKSILSDTYNTYEEAELECLKKLIEIKNR